jgi:anti-sigma28 factor (negative regulator of flagellin synthesis)
MSIRKVSNSESLLDSSQIKAKSEKKQSVAITTTPDVVSSKKKEVDLKLSNLVTVEEMQRERSAKIAKIKEDINSGRYFDNKFITEKISEKLNEEVYLLKLMSGDLNE